MLTPLIVAVIAGALGGGAVVYLVMRLAQTDKEQARLAQRLQTLEADNSQLRADQLERRQSERAMVEQLEKKDAAITQLKADSANLQRQTWPTNLNMDQQRTWLGSVALLQEVAAQDTLDALQRLNPEAVQRIVERIAPHLVKRDGIK